MAEDSGKKSRYVKLRPEICNLHLLWKVLGPICLRRRKQAIGQAIVKKIRRVYRVPMGLYQRAVYQYHLQAQDLDCNWKPAPGVKLQALRVAAAAPDSHLLEPHPLPGNVRPAEGGIVLTHRSQYSFTPKVACALTLLRDILRRGEQAAVFSAFNDPSDILSRYLTEAGIDHYLLDGRMTQAHSSTATPRESRFSNRCRPRRILARSPLWIGQVIPQLHRASHGNRPHIAGGGNPGWQTRIVRLARAPDAGGDGGFKTTRPDIS